MINNAKVKVKNEFVGKSIRVILKPTKNAVGSEETIAQEGTGFLDLLSPDASLVIHPPDGIDLKDCWIKVDAAVNLDINYSRSDSTWTFKIAPNELEPETPTTINISAGDIKPG
jgi:hypothetical protein